jgi:hypothetical protein
MPPDVTITACAPQLELADDLAVDWRAAGVVGARTAPRTPVDGAVGHDELVDPVAVVELDRPRRSPPRAPARTARRRRAGAPGDVEARHRVAVAHRRVAAALGPADGRQEAEAVPGSQERFSPAANST